MNFFCIFFCLPSYTAIREKVLIVVIGLGVVVFFSFSFHLSVEATFAIEFVSDWKLVFCVFHWWKIQCEANEEKHRKKPDVNKFIVRCKQIRLLSNYPWIHWIVCQLQRLQSNCQSIAVSSTCSNNFHNNIEIKTVHELVCKLISIFCVAHSRQAKAVVCIGVRERVCQSGLLFFFFDSVKRKRKYNQYAEVNHAQHTYTHTHMNEWNRLHKHDAVRLLLSCFVTERESSTATTKHTK